MCEIWARHIEESLRGASAKAGRELAPEEFVPLPLERGPAKQEAWEQADADLQEPHAAAAAKTAELGGGSDHYAVSPGFKLVAVPVDVPDDQAKKVAEAKTQPAGVLTLFGVADRWLANLWKRSERGDVGVG